MKKMRILLGALVLLAACSGGDLILNIDILSFLNDSGSDPSAVTVEYELPMLPAPVTVNGLPVVGPTEVQLVDAIDDLSAVREGTLFYELTARNAQGSGSAAVRLRMASDAAGLVLPGAVLTTVALSLAPADSDVVAGEVPLDDVALSVFSGQQVWFSLDMDLTVNAATAQQDSLIGEIEVTGLRARVVADEEFF